MKLIGNIIWFICGGFLAGLNWLISGIFWCITIIGIPMAIEFFVAGLTFCITIIGIPFGLQYFKLAKLSFAPFGAQIKSI